MLQKWLLSYIAEDERTEEEEKEEKPLGIVPGLLNKRNTGLSIVFLYLNAVYLLCSTKSREGNL